MVPLHCLSVLSSLLQLQPWLSTFGIVGLGGKEIHVSEEMTLLINGYVDLLL